MNIDAVSLIGKSNYEYIMSMLYAINKLPSFDDVEFEITVKDMSILSGLDLIEIDYQDEISHDIETSVNSAYRYYPEQQKLERKTVIQKIDISDTAIPIVFRFARENVIDVKYADSLNDPKKYIRKQRITYKSTIPELADWKVEKTVRFFTENPESTKLSTVLPKENVEVPEVYDIVDVEFEYTGTGTDFLLSVSSLLSVLFPAMYKYVNIAYGKVCEIIRSDLTRLGQKVSIVTQELIDSTNINKYLVSEKIDGERTLIVVLGSTIYVQTTTEFKKLLVIENEERNALNPSRRRKQEHLFIIDSEYIDNIYYIIDVLYFDGKVSNDFKEREKQVDLFMLMYSDHLSIRKLPQVTYKSWEDAFNFVNTHETSNIFKDAPIDGLVLRDDKNMYKLKNRSHLTIDFMIKYNHEDGYCYLFTIGDPKEAITSAPFTEPYSKQFFGYYLSEKVNTNSAYILADFPYPFGTYRTKIEDYEKYDGKIAEMLLTEDNKEWRPIKIRHDKEYPNGYKIAMSIYGLIFHELTERDSFKKILPDNNKLIQLKKLYPTILNTSVRSLLFTNNSSSIDAFANHHGNLGMLRIISEPHIINEVLEKLSMTKSFFGRDIKGIEFTNYHLLFNELLSNCQSFYKKTINLVIIDDLYTFADSYMDLYASCNFLYESMSKDGTIIAYVKFEKKGIQKPSKMQMISRILGDHECTKKDASHIYKINGTSYYARVPQNKIYDISMKEIAEVIPKIRDELIDPIVRYDNYRRILGKYFTIDQTILSKDNAILSLRIKDD